MVAHFFWQKVPHFLFPSLSHKTDNGRLEKKVCTQTKSTSSDLAIFANIFQHQTFMNRAKFQFFLNCENR